MAGLAHSVILIHFTEYVFAPLHAMGKNIENSILLHYKKCNISAHSEFVTTILVCSCNLSRGEKTEVKH